MASARSSGNVSEEELSRTMVEATGTIVTGMKMTELRRELGRLGLDTKGRKAELAERLGKARRSRKDEDTDSEEEDASEDEMPRQQKQMLSFRDVEESIQTFSGDGTTNVKFWLQEFEELAELCAWTDIQRVIYCKRLLRGSAKLFVRYEKCGRTWKHLKSELKTEFSETVSTHKIHRTLTERTKRPDETYHEYVYKMCDIAAQADIETAAVIQYIIDGIQDETVNKTILYGATTIRELKKKIGLYETMKENVQRKTRSYGEKEKERTRKSFGEANNPRCYNCGARNHLGVDCPAKFKGARCFTCNEFGHIARNCRKNIVPCDTPKESCSVSAEMSSKCFKEVRVGDERVKALIDTGSDLSLIRADQYFEIGAPAVGKSSLKFHGIGSKEHRVYGVIDTTIKVDGNVYPIKLHIVSDSLLHCRMLIGADFLNNVDLRIKEGNVSICKVKNCMKVQNDLSEVFKIDTIQGSDEIALTQESDRKVEKIITNYQPYKICDVNLETNFKLRGRIVKHKTDHRSSKSIANTNAFNRNPLPVEITVDGDKSEVIRKLKRAQREDAQIRAITNRVKKYGLKGYAVKSNIVYKVTNDYVSVVVPKALQTQIVRRVHEREHNAIDETVLLVKRDYWFEGVRCVAKEVVKNCQLCTSTEERRQVRGLATYN